MLHEAYFYQVKVKAMSQFVTYMTLFLQAIKSHIKTVGIVHILTYATFSNNACTQTT